MTTPFQSTFDYTLDAMSLCCLYWPWAPGYNHSPGLAFSVAGTLHSTFIIHLLAYSTSSESNLEEDRHRESGFSSVALFLTIFCCLTRKAMDNG